MCWWRKLTSCSCRSLMSRGRSWNFLDLLVAANQIHNYSNSDIHERSFTVRDVQQLHSHRLLVGNFRNILTCFPPMDSNIFSSRTRSCWMLFRRMQDCREKRDRQDMTDRLNSFPDTSKPSALLMQGDVCRRLLWIYTQGIDSSGCWSLILHILLSSVAVNLNFITQKSMPPPLQRNGRFTQLNTMELYSNTHLLLKIHEINAQQLFS